MIEHFERRAEVLNQYEDKALLFSKENRNLRNEVARLEYKIKVLESEKFYLKGQLDQNQNSVSRAVASLGLSPQNDLVKNNVYHWKNEEILAVAQDSFSKKDFEKAAQFYSMYAIKAEDVEKVGDRILFQAGVAAYESGQHYDWTLDHLSKLVEHFPTSEYFLGAKLWMGLSYLKQGKNDKFFKVVEEFRKKYRNTSEWKILSMHYDEIVHRYKN